MVALIIVLFSIIGFIIIALKTINVVFQSACTPQNILCNN